MGAHASATLRAANALMWPTGYVARTFGDNAFTAIRGPRSRSRALCGGKGASTPTATGAFGATVKKFPSIAL